MKWFVNYQPANVLDINDRGLAYGDGCFETAVYDPQHGLLHLDVHLSRLLRSLRRLAIPFSGEQSANLSLFLQALHSECLERSVIKIVVTRGAGGRGYLPPQEPNVVVAVGIAPMPDYSYWKQHGVKVSVSPITVSRNRVLAGMKHLCRLENVLAKQQLLPDEFEAIMVDEFGNVVEGIQSNIIWRKSKRWYTPALSRAGVHGCGRHVLASKLDCLTIGQFSTSSLVDADAIYFINSVAGAIPVARFQDQDYQFGQHTQWLDHQLLVSE